MDRECTFYANLETNHVSRYAWLSQVYRLHNRIPVQYQSQLPDYVVGLHIQMLSRYVHHLFATMRSWMNLEPYTLI